METLLLIAFAIALTGFVTSGVLLFKRISAQSS